MRTEILLSLARTNEPTKFGPLYKLEAGPCGNLTTIRHTAVREHLGIMRVQLKTP